MQNFNEKPTFARGGANNDSYYNHSNLADKINAFSNAILDAGITINEPIIADGEIHRFANDKGKKSGWYVSHGDWGAFGVWGKVDTVTWTLHKTESMSPDERKQLNAQIFQAKAVRDKEIIERQEAVAKQAAIDLSKLSDTGHSQYLDKKQNKAYGVKFENSFIAIPMCDVDGKLWSYQKIYDHGKQPKELEERTKDFLTGGRKKGCFHVIGDLSNSTAIYVCEGYATGASIYEATGVTTVIAFDAGKLEHVIAAIKSKYPSIFITIAADNDKWKEINIGRIKAEEAVKKHGCNVIFPEFSDAVKKGDSNA